MIKLNITNIQSRTKMTSSFGIETKTRRYINTRQLQCFPRISRHWVVDLQTDLADTPTRRRLVRGKSPTEKEVPLTSLELIRLG